MIILEDRETPYGRITISRARDSGVTTYELAGYCQSEVDAGGVSLAPYIHALYGLVSESGARRVLLVGCGGGTLGTMLARSGSSVTIVDVNPVSFDLARRYFGLPESVGCAAGDAKAWLQESTATFDAVVLDAYHGGHLSPHLLSPRFFEAVRSRLAKDGAVFANVYVSHDSDESADRVAGCMAGVWPGVRLLDCEGTAGRNAIVMAGAVAKLGQPHVQVPPAVDRDEIARELAAMRYRSVRKTPPG